MAKTEALYVIAYDIHHDGNRNRVVLILEEVAVRVQLSVFEGRMTRPKMLNLKERIALMIDDGDQVRFYHLNDSCVASSERLGGAPFPENQEFWLL